uniref:Integrase, catalytic region, zinc finger, CCHC-type, peptidase aspartic, catalytic n=1 Tax=Tanacetum cinerariifolium TaxID=118510 RepID=A0A699JZQ9_TANCI|nr:hypothetical protein [Tanacetum cinerariifolium]
MTTLAEHIIVVGAKNRPPMLEKSMYNSWESRIHLFTKENKNGRMMLDSIDEGLVVYPTVVGEDGHTRPKKYFELTEAQQLQDDCDVQAKNIILHGLPPDVYALVNHQEAAKDVWDRVKLLIKGTKLSYQERKCRSYNLFDKFSSIQDETLYVYYWRFSQLINDMHTIRMTMQQQGEDLIDCINKAMAFLSVVALREIATTSKGKYVAGQAMVVKFYNCLGEGHMAKQSTQPKRPRSSTWFKEKLMLVEAQEAGQILDEEQLAFIADPGIAKV